MTSEPVYLDATIYDIRTGQIIANITGGLDVIKAQGHPYVMGKYDPDTHYILNAQSTSNPVPAARPAQNTQQDATVITPGVPVVLSSLPYPSCVVRIAGQEYVVEDGVLEWQTHQTGVYDITVESSPYLDWHGKVVVTEVSTQ